MSEPPTYFVRLGREVEGPLTGDEVRRRLELRLLSGYHEVSTDQKHWRPLAESRGRLAAEQGADALPAGAADGPFFELAGGHEDDASRAAEATPDGLDRYDRLGPFDAGGLLASPSPIADGRVARLARSLAVSAGVLLLVATSLPIPAADGVRAAWWQRPGALSVVLGVWGGLGCLLVFGALIFRCALRARVVLGVGALGWLAGGALLGLGGAVAINAAGWLVAAPLAAWGAARWLPSACHPNRADARGLVGVGLLLAVLWLAAVALGIQQNLHHADGNHYLSQLVLTATGGLAWTAALTAGAIERPPRDNATPTPEHQI